MNLGQSDQALRLSQELAEIHHKSSVAQLLYGQILYTLGHFQKAFYVLKIANQLSPQSAEILTSMGQVSQELGRTKDSLDFYGQALALEPTVERMTICGHFLFEIGQLEEAEQLLTIATSQGNLQAVASLILLRLRQNRAPEAADLVSQFIDRLAEEPSLAHATARLMLSQQEIHSSLDVLQMLNIQDLSTGKKLQHLRLLGETYDKLQQYKKSFFAYQQFNNARSCQYNPETHQKKINAILERFTDTSCFQTVSDCSSNRIVFIVGMPRSGSSLLEQILSMHPHIYAAGELDHIPALIKEHGTDSKEQLNMIAQTYLERLNLLSEHAQIVTDKLPHNYIHLGELARIFPQARIIYCRRDPIDTGWSCYRQNFHSSLSYATDLWSIGHFQARLQELMEHWKQVLPLPILEVSYENLVQNLPNVAHQVLKHCGLEWDPSVLEFHRSNRSVHTASSLQVQKPLYTSSIGNAKPYGKFLRPLLNGLNS